VPGQTGGSRPNDDGSVRAYERTERWADDAHAAANEVSRWEAQIPPSGNEDFSKPWR
jgi:hypothetical protein